MSGFDIALGLPLLFAAYTGFRDGILVQLGGIAGLIIGIFVGLRYGSALGEWIGLEGVIAQVCGFLIIILLCLLGLALLGRATKGVFRIAGMRALDATGGIVLGILKMGLLLSVMLIAFDVLNEQQEWVTAVQKENSILYTPVKRIAGVVFPYVDFVTEQLL